MKIFRYQIYLENPLFYSKEGLSGAIPPLYLHATALNCALATALNLETESQSYIINTDEKNHRNVPRYNNSKICEEFYLTPARPENDISLQPEYVKGETDGFAIYGYEKKQIKVKDNIDIEFFQGGYEILKYSKLFFIPAETIFFGFGWCDDNLKLPEIIRLGTFRLPARIFYENLEYLKLKENKVADHPVDPLIIEVKRGISITTFPYPIVDYPLCSYVWEVKSAKGQRFKIAPIEGMENLFKDSKSKRIKGQANDTVII